MSSIILKWWYDNKYYAVCALVWKYNTRTPHTTADHMEIHEREACKSQMCFWQKKTLQEQPGIVITIWNTLNALYLKVAIE
jgi:hypothetical protein